MAHGISATDEIFSVRQEMWHGLGTVLPDYATREVIQPLVHPWEPEAEPVYRKRVRTEQRPHQHTEKCRYLLDCPQTGTLQDVDTESFEIIGDATLNVRSDNQAALGVVSSTFTPVSNATLYDVAEAIEGGARGSVRYETGGSLHGGRKVWLLIRLKDPIVVPGDPNGSVIPYYALQNAHDGSGSFRGQALLTRIVCANTAAAADFEAGSRGTEMVFSHTKNVMDRVEEAKRALAGWRSSVEAFQDQAAHLMELGITPVQRELFLEKFIPMPLAHTASDRVVTNVEAARSMIRDILAGPTSEGISNNAYGLVQASIEYLGHGRRAHSLESRFERSYLKRNVIVADAVKLAQGVALNV